ncbi:MAG: hypothetical protein JWQ35_2072 [Bacteriovoracaceae bacterium]|nr:hypothetical protein [Bacteriovoracaceae bacterium]
MQFLKTILLCIILFLVTRTSYAQEQVKLIFLDFDGVLNSYSRSSPYCFYKLKQLHGIRISPDLVQKLNRMIDKNNAKVVISASVRKIKSIEELIAALRSAGFKGEIIGKTPTRPEREDEIKSWLSENRNKYQVAKYIVLEDESEDFTSLKEHIVKVNGQIGLTDANAKFAQKLLK